MNRRLLVVLLIAPLLGLAGVVAAELVPDGRIAYHLLRAEETGLTGPIERSPSPLGTITDHYSECVAVTVGLGDPPGANLLARALRSPAYYGCEEMSLRLGMLADTGRLAPGWTYLRYWHGHALITRPAIGVLGLAGARWVGFAVLLAAVAGMATAVRRRFGWPATAVLLAPTLLTTDQIIGGLTVSQAIGMATAWAGGWAALEITARHPDWRTVALVAGLAGCANAYFDLMTTIAGAMALTAAGAVLGYASARTIVGRDAWRLPVAATAGWVVGLAWMWTWKWLLAIAALGFDEVYANVREQIEFRIAGDFAGVSPQRWRGLAENIAEWWDRPLTPWLIVVLVVAGVAQARRTRSHRPRWWPVVACCAIVGAAVAAWYVLLNNHTQIHSWLTYRSLPITVGGLAAVAVAFGRRAGGDDTPTAPGRTP